MDENVSSVFRQLCLSVQPFPSKLAQAWPDLLICFTSLILVGAIHGEAQFCHSFRAGSGLVECCLLPRGLEWPQWLSRWWAFKWVRNSKNCVWTQRVWWWHYRAQSLQEGRCPAFWTFSRARSKCQSGWGGASKMYIYMLFMVKWQLNKWYQCYGGALRRWKVTPILLRPTARSRLPRLGYCLPFLETCSIIFAGEWSPVRAWWTAIITPRLVVLRSAAGKAYSWDVCQVHVYACNLCHKNHVHVWCEIHVMSVCMEVK